MWNLLPNEEQTQIADSVRDYLARELPVDRFRPKAKPRDAARVRAGMVELGWFGLGLPESVGGAGLGVVEEQIVQRECGRYLVSPSVLATVLGAHVAAEAGDGVLAGELISGGRGAALAIVADAEAGEAFAFDRSAGNLLLVWNDAGIGLFDAAAFTNAAPHTGLDDSVGVEAGTLTPGSPRYWLDAAGTTLVLRAQVLVAASMCGIALHATELSVEYAKVRQQFGKPIGTFQAVKHRCADMGIRAQLAWSQAMLAGLKVGAGAPDAPVHVASAVVVAADAAHENGRASIQVHGGIGFQAECDVHWFMKRAHLYEQAAGTLHRNALQLAAAPYHLW
ncbi:MAG: acyl-CoA dehydrogenase family protein [Gammaproteobacteria bacterium]